MEQKTISSGKLGFNLAKNGVELKIGIQVLFDELNNILKVPENPLVHFELEGFKGGEHSLGGLKF